MSQRKISRGLRNLREGLRTVKEKMATWKIVEYFRLIARKTGQRNHAMCKRFIRIIIPFILLAPLMHQVAQAAEPSINVSILGEVVGNKNAAMKGAFERWISLNGRTYPLVDGANLRANDGTMTILFRDSARMEVGRGSDLLVTGEIGHYQANVRIGNVGFAAPRGSSFSISTPNAAIYTLVTQGQDQSLQQGDLTVVDTVRGVVRYDGKGTLIIAVTGTTIMRGGNGGGDHTIREGEAVYVTEDGSSRFIPAALIQRGLNGAPVAVIGGDIVPAWWPPLQLLGLAAFIEADTYAAVYRAPPVPASPSGFTLP